MPSKRVFPEVRRGRRCRPFPMFRIGKTPHIPVQAPWDQSATMEDTRGIWICRLKDFVHRGGKRKARQILGAPDPCLDNYDATRANCMDIFDSYGLYAIKHSRCSVQTIDRTCLRHGASPNFPHIISGSLFTFICFSENRVTVLRPGCMTMNANL